MSAAKVNRLRPVLDSHQVSCFSRSAIFAAGYVGSRVLGRIYKLLAKDLAKCDMFGHQIFQG